MSEILSTMFKNGFFSKFPMNIVTLNEGKGHPRLHHFEGVPTGCPLASYHDFALNSVRVFANVKVCHGRTDGRTDGQTTEGHYIDSLCLHT